MVGMSIVCKSAWTHRYTFAYVIFDSLLGSKCRWFYNYQVIWDIYSIQTKILYIYIYYVCALEYQETYWAGDIGIVLMQWAFFVFECSHLVVGCLECDIYWKYSYYFAGSMIFDCLESLVCLLIGVQITIL